MSDSFNFENKLVIAETAEDVQNQSEAGTSKMSGDRPTKRAGRRPGRRGSKMDVRSKLERSRQSARECRARKKLRYQYLEDLVANREKAVFALRDELELYKQWCMQVDNGFLPLALQQLIEKMEATHVNDSTKEKAKELDVSVTCISSDSEENDDTAETISESQDIQKVPNTFTLPDSTTKSTYDKYYDVFKVPILKKCKFDEDDATGNNTSKKQSFQSKDQRTIAGKESHLFGIPGTPMETGLSSPGSTGASLFPSGATGSSADMFTTIRMDDLLQEVGFHMLSASSIHKVNNTTVEEVPSLFANIARSGGIKGINESSDTSPRIAINLQLFPPTSTGEGKSCEFTADSKREDSPVEKSRLPTIIEDPDN